MKRKEYFIVFFLLLMCFSCRRARVVDVKFQAYYFMNVDTISILFEDYLHNILLDTTIATKHNININFQSQIRLPNDNSYLCIRVNAVDTVLYIERDEKLSIEYTNMNPGDEITPMTFGREYEKIVIDRRSIKNGFRK